MFDIDDAVEALWEAAGDEGPDGWAEFRPDGGFRLHPDPWSLVGVVAAPGVAAVGVVCGGTVHRLDGSAPGGRVRVCCVVARDGTVAGVSRFGDGVTLRDAPAAGRMLDVLRRSVGVPTPPPPEPVGAVLGLAWLGTIGLADGGGALLDWPTVAALHPAAPLVADGADADGGWGLATTVATLGWDEVVDRLAEGRIALQHLGQTDPTWWDPGSLCRWVLDAQGDAGAVVADAVAAMDPVATATVEAVLRFRPGPLSERDRHCAGRWRAPRPPARRRS